MSEKADVMGYGDRSSGEQIELEFKGRNGKEKAADMNTPTYKPCQLNAAVNEAAIQSNSNTRPPITIFSFIS